MARRVAPTACLALVLSLYGLPAHAQTASSSEAMAAYRALRAFTLDGGSATVSNLRMTRDRAEMTFTGTFYFTRPVLGRITGAVFVGTGRFRAEPPPSLFEKENLQRVLKADLVESDFATAVLRFTDDAPAVIGPATEGGGAAPAALQERAADFEARALKETGANVASRLLLSMLDNEQPGVFVAQFDGGRRGRFTFLMDHQGRIPTTNFGINGGEKGLIFSYDPRGTNAVWLAFYALADYESGRATYSDASDLVDAVAYRLRVDLREPRKALRLSGEIDVVAKGARVSMIPFALTEGLGETGGDRLKRGMRLQSARANGKPIDFIQEEWEGGFTLVLPEAMNKGEDVSLAVEAAGDFLREAVDIECFFPAINGQWYPRHGYLDRSIFDLSFLHQKRYKVASAGVRLKDSAPSDDKDVVETSYRMEQPVALVTFALGNYKVHSETFKLQPSGEVPLELFSVNIVNLKESFMLGEMGNALNYFGALFGPYPYPIFRAAYHPFGFGQGFATMLVVPNADSGSKRTYQFLSHETGHQWWGNIVGWRSYRDQWLSEGFAEYSGILYTEKRDKPSSARDLIVEARLALKQPPRVANGTIGAGKVTDIGPLVLGHRLASLQSINAYQGLIYDKGALVLRMLHFLFSNLNTGADLPFFEMMKDFVNRHRNGSATTEEFVEVASDHFASTPIAQQFGMKDLDWFFKQWVWQTGMPTYRLEYALENQPGGKVSLKGTLFQDGVPEDWAMPIPVVFKFAGGKTAHTTILAQGPRQPVNLTLPLRPDSVELDPEMWVLSDKTSTKKQ